MANAQQQSITPYAISGGQLQPAASAVLLKNSAPAAVAATAQSRLLYAATEAGDIELYRIASDGSLQLANGGTAVAHVDHPVRMSLDRSGTWLFVASSNTAQLHQFRVNAVAGTLQPVAASAAALGAPAAAQIYFSPDNRNLFAALGKGGVDAFSFDPNSGVVGARLHIAPLGSGNAQDSALTSDEKSKFLFVGETGSGIRVLRIVADGILEEAGSSPMVSPGMKSVSLAVAGDGRRLFVADSESDTIRDFSIGARGALTPVSRTPSNLAASPAALSVAAGGRYLITLSGSSAPSLKIVSTGSMAGTGAQPQSASTSTP